MKKDSWEALVEEVAHRYAEGCIGHKLTGRQFSAYCRAIEKADREMEIEAAIALLEGSGYGVVPPSVTRAREDRLGACTFPTPPS